jgi:hypothetical protein
VFRIVVYLVASLIACDRAFAHETFQLSPDDSTVTYPNGNQSAVKTTDCKQNAPTVIAQFQQYLVDTKEPGRIVGCELETSTWYFAVFETDYFAGFFTLEKDGERSKVAICYNGGVGYVVTKAAPSMTRHELVVFMMGNCTAG